SRPVEAAPAAPRLGVQLWSVKDEVKKDFEGTLTRLAGLGFEGVEFAGEFGRFANDAVGCAASWTRPACNAPAPICISRP
ncbi:MAG: hypothetical protein QM796_10985, partial [Chthoniobacteraceae bacterium]